VLILSLIGFLVSVYTATSVQILEMGEDQFFLLQIMPLGYWAGIVLIILALLMGFLFFRNKLSPAIVLICCLLLGISMRITFPGPFPDPVSFSSDNAFYMGIINPWLTTGIDFGVEGKYQHDFPLAFLISYFVVKLGVPIDVFFRWAPTIVFAINYIIIYSIFSKLFHPEKTIYVGFALFLSTSSTLKFFMPANYCPNLIGSIFFLLSLYLSLSFYKLGWSIRAIVPAIISIILLILSHHLSIVYFVVLMMGIALVAKFFQGNKAKGAELRLFFIAIFSYTFWWAYGHFVYPSFFNNYVLGSSPQGTITRVSMITGFDLFALVTQPILIFTLFIIGIVQYLNLSSISTSKNFLKLMPIYILGFNRIKLEKGNDVLLFSIGSFTIGMLLAMSFVLTNLYSDRVLDVFLLGLYPISSMTLLNLSKGKSRKVKLLVTCILVLLFILSIYRYFRENQRAHYLS
jgi:hypothetical protein